MGKMIRFIAVAILCISSATILPSWSDSQASNSKNIVVEIDYGDVRPSRTVEVQCVKAKTVLELLQTAAMVETHPVGEYVIVTSIDGVQGKRGDMAWYYTTDGKPSDKIAYSKSVDGVTCIKWVYKKDTCSAKVDQKKL